MGDEYNQIANAGGKKKAPQVLRVLMVFVFATSSISGGIIKAPMNPITKTMKKGYDQSIGEINLFASLWQFAGLIAGLIATSIMGKLGVRKSLIFGTSLYFICSVTRLFINESMIWMYVSSIVGGFGYPFIEYGASPFVAHWFDDEEMGLFVTILSCTQTLGVMIAALYPFMFIDPNAKISVVRDQTLLYMKSLCSMSVWVLFASWLFYHENKIRHRAQALSEKQSEAGGEPVKSIPLGEQLKYFVTDSRYLSLLGGFLCILVGSMVIATNLTTMFVTWGYSEVRPTFG